MEPLAERHLPACRRLQRFLDEPAPRLLNPPLVVDGHVSLADGRVVGYVVALGDAERHVAELVVHPDFRRAGRGRALLERTLAGSRRATVAVAPDNDAALSLYESLGFEERERRGDYFESGAALFLAR